MFIIVKHEVRDATCLDNNWSVVYRGQGQNQGPHTRSYPLLYYSSWFLSYIVSVLFSDLFSDLFKWHIFLIIA